MGNSVPLTPWQIIGMVFAVVAALWYVTQDNRASLKDYLTIREHAEYAANARADLQRVEAENKGQVSRDEFKSWQEQRTNLTNDMNARINAAVTRGELTAHLSKDQDVLANLQRQIEQLRADMRDGKLAPAPNGVAR